MMLLTESLPKEKSQKPHVTKQRETEGKESTYRDFGQVVEQTVGLGKQRGRGESFCGRIH